MNGRDRKNPGAATPKEFTLPVDGWLSAQQFEALQRGLRAVELGFDGSDSRLENRKLRGDGGAGSTGELNALGKCFGYIHRPSLKFVFEILERAHQVCAGRKPVLSKQKLNVFGAVVKIWPVVVLYEQSPHFLGKRPQVK